MYELEARYDSRKSFYGKAMVQDGVLYSYGTPVVERLGGSEGVRLLPAWDTSATTLRHVKEYLRQIGLKAETKAQIARDYKESK